MLERRPLVFIGSLRRPLHAVVRCRLARFAPLPLPQPLNLCAVLLLRSPFIVARMKITYEVTDVAMIFDPIMDGADGWPIQFSNGQSSGRGGRRQKMRIPA